MKHAILLLELILAFFIAGFAFIFAAGLWVAMQAFEKRINHH